MHAIFVTSLILHSVCPITFPPFLNLVFLSIRDLRRIRYTLDYTQLRTLSPHLSYTQNSITTTRFSEPFPVSTKSSSVHCQLSARTVSLSLSLSLSNSATSLLFWSLSIGFTFNSLSHVQFYLSPTQLFSLDNLLISSAYSMFNLTVQLAGLTSSPCNILQFAHVYSRLSNWQVFYIYPPCSRTLEFSTQTTATVLGASITRHTTDSTPLLVLASVSL